MSTPKQFFLLKSNKFLDLNDQFKAIGMSDRSLQPFETKDAALDKAEALGLDLDSISVISGRKRRADPDKED